MNEQEIIAAYERILGYTSQMLEAARASDWDRLVELERGCRQIVDSLAATSSATALPPRLHQRKVEIIHRVLADDAEIRRVTQPWMTELEGYLAATRNSQRLAGTYGLDACG